MTVALVRTNPLELIQVPGGDVIDIAIAGIEASAVSAGWRSPDGAFAVVAVTPFAVPAGKVAVGAPSYSLTAGAVVESYNVQDVLPVIVPPLQVTPRQARLALLAAGLLSQVEAAVNAAGGATQITWNYATVIDRRDPMIASIATGLNLTAKQVDDLFAAASAL